MMFPSYADWYRPPKPWQQPVVHPDTLVGHLLQLRSPQPSADLGSLCVVMMATSPHGSLNWAKVPCDYPIYRASLICKKPAAAGKNALPFRVFRNFYGPPFPRTLNLPPPSIILYLPVRWRVGQHHITGKSRKE